MRLLMGGRMLEKLLLLQPGTAPGLGQRAQREAAFPCNMGDCSHRTGDRSNGWRGDRRRTPERSLLFVRCIRTNYLFSSSRALRKLSREQSLSSEQPGRIRDTALSETDGRHSMGVWRDRPELSRNEHALGHKRIHCSAANAFGWAANAAISWLPVANADACQQIISPCPPPRQSCPAESFEVARSLIPCPGTAAHIYNNQSAYDDT